MGWFRVNEGIHGIMLSGGVYTSFDHPEAVATPPYGGTAAFGINNLGQIVGAYNASSDTVRGFLRDCDNYVDLMPFGPSDTWASAINDSGMIAGFHQLTGGDFESYVFDGTSHIEFNDPDADDTYAWDINNAGEIVGDGWESSGPPHAYIRLPDGTLTKFVVFGYPADAFGTNDSRQIVGAYGPSPDELYGYVLSGGIGSTPEMLVVPGSSDTVAHDINNLGQVIGMYSNANGNWRGFLATPIAAADFDKDGDADGADLTLWQGDYGLNANCDADGDGDTDGRDFLVWQRQYIAGVPGLANELSIPEPATVLLALMALAGSALGARNTF